MRHSFLIALFLALLTMSSVHPLGAASHELPLFRMTLSEAEKAALDQSHHIAAQQANFAQAQATAKSQGAKRFPSLSLEGSTRFASKVGEVNMPIPGTPPVQIGDHYSWSVGPVLEWVAFDAGSIAKNAESLRRIADSESDNLASVERRTLQNVRLAYVAVQLALEQLRLVSESLHLARAQYRDVSLKSNAGSASKLDLVTAHQEVVDRERDFQEAQTELAVRVRELIAITGQEQYAGAITPIGKGIGRSDGSLPADLAVEVDPISRTLADFMQRARPETPVESHPSVTAADKKREAAIVASKSVRSQHWPKVSVLARSTYEYPNFGELVRVQQNALTLGLRMPLLDWGLISQQAKSEQFKAKVAEEQRNQTIQDLTRDLAQALDRIELLKARRVTSASAVRDATEAARLVYESYQAGLLTFLEVQRANTRALMEKVESARTDATLVSQIVRLREIAGSEGGQ